MPPGAPGPGCFDLAFQARYPVTEPGEVALEDYTRALAKASAAFGLRADEDPSLVRGVHVCGLGASPTLSLLTDIEDFARSLAQRTGNGGLGWS